MRLALDAVRIAVTVFAVSILQVSAAPQLSPFHAAPDLVVIVVVALVLWRGIEVAAAAGFAAGLLLDAMLFGHVGEYSLMYVLAAVAVGRFARPGEPGAGMVMPRPPRFLPWVLGAASLVQLGYALMEWLLGGFGYPASFVWWNQIVPSVLQTMIVAILVAPLLRRMFDNQQRARVPAIQAI
ncbi:MAG TPA: rod shape-determining protein MreD [Gaiellales bacterium]|nr:rod shape-determining protein MreD [Gaiellales bacterium]